jgi:hypothetical protein
MKRKHKTPKPRNPVAAFAKRSGSGVHSKTKKAIRRKETVEFKKQCALSSAV